MSDLQVKGIIDRQQKNILKDLIITGNDTLQSALDLYKKGDSSQLEDMIKSGAIILCILDPHCTYPSANLS